MTLSQTQATVGALADSDPTETVVVSLQPPPESGRDGSGSGRISQTTEHLLIAAGSIGGSLGQNNLRKSLTEARRDDNCRDGCTGHLYNAQTGAVIR